MQTGPTLPLASARSNWVEGAKVRTSQFRKPDASEIERIATSPTVHPKDNDSAASASQPSSAVEHRFEQGWVNEMRGVRLVLVLVSLLAIVGCESSETRSATQSASPIGSAELALLLASGTELERVHYVISKGSLEAARGDVHVTHSREISFQVGGLEAADDYAVSLTAMTTSGESCSSTKTPFAVQVGETTTLLLKLTCGDVGTRRGNVRLDVDVDMDEGGGCAEVDGLSALPRSVNVGGEIELKGFSTLDGADFAWTAPAGAGTFSSASSAKTTFSCDLAGTHTVTLDVSNDSCAPDTAEVEIRCTSEDCASRAERVCKDGSPHWRDGCGGLSDEPIEACETQQTCLSGFCIGDGDWPFSGYIIDSSTGRPIPNAAITLASGETFHSGPSGWFGGSLPSYGVYGGTISWGSYSFPFSFTHGGGTSWWLGCSSSGCGAWDYPSCAGERCTVGSRGHFCVFTGDPHVRTFDGLFYEMQAVGEFVLARSTSGTTFEVQARTAAVDGRTDLSQAVAVSATIDGDQVAFNFNEAQATWEFQFGGVAVDPSAPLPGGGTLTQSGDRYVIKATDGSQLWVWTRSNYLDINIVVAPERDAEMEGLCGNSNETMADDLALPRPMQSTTFGSSLPFDTLYGDYVKSWVVADSPFEYKLPTEPNPDDPTAEQRAKAKDVCVAQGVLTQPWLSACIVDVAVTSDGSFARSCSESAVDPVRTILRFVGDDFEANAGGWTVMGDATISHSRTGGNPGGLVSATDLSRGKTWYFRAPTRYYGDASMLYGATLSFDLLSTNVSNPYIDADVILSGGGLTLVYDAQLLPATGWTSYVVPLTESGWRLDSLDGSAVTEAQFRQALDDVTDLQIRGEFNLGADTGSLDNVLFGAAPPVEGTGGSGGAGGAGGADNASGIERVSAGMSSACAIVSGAVQCWGSNYAGVLGNGSTTDSSVPVPVTGLKSGASEISVDRGLASSACAVVSGGVQCWGSNRAGQLGNGTEAESSVPVQVTGLTSGVTAVSVHYNNACAIVSGGLQCWGWAGLLGNETSSNSYVPVAVQALKSGVTSVSVGASSACAIVAGGLQCWGSNSRGQLGNGTKTDSSVPVPVAGLTNGVTDVSVGTNSACAVASGALLCWGQNDSGVLGNGSRDDSDVPVQVAGLTSGVTDVSVGYANACAVVSGGVQCWGANEVAQSVVPMPVPGLTSGVTAVSDGYTFACALSSGRAMCWGGNSKGQLGNGTTNPSTAPVTVENL